MEVHEKMFTPKLLTWKLKDQVVINQFKDSVVGLLAKDTNKRSVEDQWILMDQRS